MVIQRNKFLLTEIDEACAVFERQSDCSEHIDTALSESNYNLAASDQPLPLLEKIRKRMEDVPHTQREELKLMIDLTVSTPQDLPEKEHRAFFESCYRFLCERYGTANVVSAYVHNDEICTSPHMHFAFIPVTEDNRISSTRIIDTPKIKKLRKAMKARVEQDLGHYIGSGTTEERRYIEMLKSEIRRLCKERNALRAECEALRVAAKQSEG